jgi:hypothetical protein
MVFADKLLGACPGRSPYGEGNSSIRECAAKVDTLQFIAMSSDGNGFERAFNPYTGLPSLISCSLYFLRFAFGCINYGLSCAYFINICNGTVCYCKNATRLDCDLGLEGGV